MSYPIKFLSLQKTELEYEVSVRGETPASTVADIRKQISKLSQIYPSEDILCSHLEPSEDLAISLDLLDKIKSTFTTEVLDKNILARTENVFHHLYHRLNRIDAEEKLSKHLECNTLFKELYERLLTFKKKSVDPLSVTDLTSSESRVLSSPINVKVTCDGKGRIAGELGKLKYDGKTCVRSFIQRVNEFSEARDISGSKLLSYATEIFVDSALHWFRSVKEQVSTWDELVVLLKQDFDKSDYDYRLLSEIRSRTQGERENITIYLSILSGMFGRLSKPLLEEDKLEIILHNIRPGYASTLASATEIKSIEQLRLLCRNFENVQSRLVQFREPAAATSDTLAPEFARKSFEFNVGDIVYKRAYVLSDKDKFFSKKLAPKYIKCKVLEKRSPLFYVLEDMSGKNLGTWHIKDLKIFGQQAC
ncbi:Gag polyprotein [Operophtera brumata]|uniref:Gag polyprotein n=1 Tax=Operophtera brumata TaxID=104452 RepID=A0A0L7LNY3_OPEBR|nr:Gag polyprotein [Operophtera brumata]